jgi:signal peptidase II
MSQEHPTPEAAPASEAPRPSYLFLAFHSVLWAVMDLVTKSWAHETLAGYDPTTLTPKKVVLIEGYLQFIFAQNPGGAWSFLRSLPEVLRRPFFMFISVAAIVFIVSVYRRLHPDQRALRWGLPLALGGAIGNLVDRVRYGWVVDFVDAFVVRNGREYHWPTFNVADIAIVLGVGLMAVDVLLQAKRLPKRTAPAEAPRPEAG